MRRLKEISLVLILIFVFSATACEKSNVEEVSPSKQPTTTSLYDNSINNANNATEPSINEVPIDTSSAEVSATTNSSEKVNTETPMLFSQQYKNVEELEGEEIECETIEYEPDLLDSVDDNANELSDVWINKNRGLIISQDISGKTVIYACYGAIDLYSLGNKVYYLPQNLSNKIRIFNFEDWVKNSTNGYAISNEYYMERRTQTTPKNSRFIMFDDENNIVIVAGFEGQELIFYKAVQVPDDFKLSDYTVEMAYENRAIISSKLNNDLLTIDTETLQLIECNKMQNWETLCGYNDKLFLQKESNARNYSLYQIDREKNILRVYDAKANKVLKEYDLGKLPVKGKFINVSSDREGWLALEYKEEESEQPIRMYFYNTAKDQLMTLNEDDLKRLNEVKQIDNTFFYYFWIGDGSNLDIIFTAYDREGKKSVFIVMARDDYFNDINLMPIKTDLKGFKLSQ